MNTSENLVLKPLFKQGDVIKRKRLEGTTRYYRVIKVSSAKREYLLEATDDPNVKLWKSMGFTDSVNELVPNYDTPLAKAMREME
jgi:hypothetical protein